MENRSRLQQLPVRSGEIRDLKVEATPGRFALTFTFVEDAGVRQGMVEFTGVRAYRHCAEVHCTAWHVKDAYDTLVLIEESGWAAEMRAQTSEGWQDKWKLNHYLIYLDSAGSYEVLGDAWNVVAPVAEDQ